MLIHLIPDQEKFHQISNKAWMKTGTLAVLFHQSITTKKKWKHPPRKLYLLLENTYADFH